MFIENVTITEKKAGCVVFFINKFSESAMLYS